MPLPSLIKAEVKLTTGSGVSLSARELEALAVGDPSAAGLVAAIFWGQDREVDGRWVIVDAGWFRGRRGETVSATRPALAGAARSQPWLDAVRAHVDARWPAFLDGFKDEALEGHAALVEALARTHREATVAERLPAHPILAAEHRATVGELLARHGESDAGRIVQDLLAYLLADAGYRKVTNNPVGVPDFVLAELAGPAAAARTVHLALTEDEAERLLGLCRASGELELARVVARRAPRS
jgi:hypothetical protein